MMRSLLLALFLTTSLMAQRLDLPVEVPVAAPEIGEIVTNREPRVATDGFTFLAVWTDEREQYKFVTYAARFTIDGALLDPIPIRLGDGTAGDVIWNGRSFVVSMATGGQWKLVLLDSNANIVAERLLASRYERELELATNGENMLLAAANVGVLLDLDGNLIRSFRLASADNLDVASAGRDYVVTFRQSNKIHARPVKSDGTRGEPVLMAENVDHHDIAIASDGASYLIAYMRKSLVARAIDANGNALAPERTLHTVAAEGMVSPPSLAHDGDGYTATYGVGFLLYEVRASNSGELRDARLVAHGSRPAIAISGSTTGYVYLAERAGVKARVSRGGVMSEPMLLSRGVRPQLVPRIASVGSSVVAAWAEQNEIRIAYVGGTPRVVATVRYPPRMEVLFDGRFVWVVWEDIRIFVRRYTPALEPVDDAALAVADLGFDWSVAAGRDGIMIIASHDDGGARIPPIAFPDKVIATAVYPSGASLAIEETLLVDEDRSASSPAVAWNGSEYVAAWIWGWPSGNEVAAVRVTREGARIDPVPIVVAAGTSVHTVRAAMANGGGVVFGWQEGFVTYAAIFRGNARPAAQRIRSSNESLRHVVPTSSGYAFFWGGSWTPDVGIQVQRLNQQLTPSDELRLVNVPGIVDNFDAAAVGNALYVSYARPANGVSRAFIRHAQVGPRQRTVR